MTKEHCGSRCVTKGQLLENESELIADAADGGGLKVLLAVVEISFCPLRRNITVEKRGWGR